MVLLLALTWDRKRKMLGGEGENLLNLINVKQYAAADISHTHLNSRNVTDLIEEIEGKSI